MRIRLAVPDAAMTPAVLDTALEAVTRTNEHLLTEGNVPTAEEAIAHGIKWRPEPPGDEHFDHASTVLKRGHGDCDDLAPWHAASLRHTGEDPGAKAIVVRSGPKRWHAIVQRSDGRIDDPSADAGMYEYRSPVQPRLKGDPSRPNVHTREVNGVWTARCDVPWQGSNYAISCHAAAPSRVHAVRQAISGACIVGDASGAVSPDMVKRLALLDDLLRGVPPHLVKGACAAYLRAHPDVAGHESVGSLFGGLLKAASSFVPGGRAALDAAGTAADMLRKKGHAPAPPGAPGYEPNAHHGFGPTVGPNPSRHSGGRGMIYSPAPAPYYGAAPAQPIVVVRY
jgi:hypothetical protein